MTKSELFKEAHKMTREMKNDYPEISYKAQFGISLKSLLNKSNKSINKGSEKQIKWANDILSKYDTFINKAETITFEESTFKTEELFVRGKERINNFITWIFDQHAGLIIEKRNYLNDFDLRSAFEDEYEGKLSQRLISDIYKNI